MTVEQASKALEILNDRKVKLSQLKLMLTLSDEDLIIFTLQDISEKLSALLQTQKQPSPNSNQPQTTQQDQSEQETEDPTMRVISADQGYEFKDPAKVAEEAEKRFKEREYINARQRALMEEHYKESLAEAASHKNSDNQPLEDTENV